MIREYEKHVDKRFAEQAKRIKEEMSKLFDEKTQNAIDSTIKKLETEGYIKGPDSR